MLNNRLLYELGLLVKYQESHPEVMGFSIHTIDPLTLNLGLLIKSHPYHFQLVFPRFFPYQPIIVQSLEKRKISAHQYVNGSMCLKWGIDNWDENITIKTILDNLIELLVVENFLGEEHGVVESGDKFTISQEISQEKTCLIVDEKDLSLFSKKSGNGTLIVKASDDYGLYFIKSVGQTKKYYSFKSGYRREKFNYVKLEMEVDDKNVHELLFHPQIDFQNIDKFLFVSKNNKLILLGRVEATQEEKNLWLEKMNDEERQTHRINTLWKRFLIPAKYLNEEKEKRIKIDPIVLRKRIAILGLGSIGSRVLIDLARTGFSNFLLCDDDIFMPNNILRHELMADSVGELKIQALAKTIQEHINSVVDVICFRYALNGQESSSCTNALLEGIAKSDLIVDCTADSNLIFSLNEIVTQKDLNYISGSVISGGLGNILIKREKGSKLSLIDIVESQKKFFKINNQEKIFSSDYSGKMGNKEYVATMSDCSIIAGLIGKNAINMLANDSEEYLKNDIFVFSTSNNFLGDSYACYPLNANKRECPAKKLSQTMIVLGKRYYENNPPNGKDKANIG